MSATRGDQRGACPGGASSGPELVTRPVDEVEGLDELLAGCHPSFGGAFLRRIWSLLDEAIGRGIPMTLSVAGPVTLSGQHRTWLGPLLETGWFALISTTDAVCYHDGHRALDSAAEHPIHEVPIFGDDGGLRDERTIRVTDIGFDEDVLLEQDHFLRTCLRSPEFQRRMTGTEMRFLLGRRYAAQEKQNGVLEGLVSQCTRMAIPIFVGAPADGSVFLNSVHAWAAHELGGAAYAFELDMHGEVFESCAYHLWANRESGARAFGTLVLGGGVPKNFNLQPEPALSQILGVEDVPGFLYDIQLTSAPITDGSLSSCPPSEAVTWGKVDREQYQRTTESFQCDYTVVMPLLTKALLDKRARFERWSERMGREALLESHPEAAGYLRERAGYRLYDERERLVAALFDELRERGHAQGEEEAYPLAPQDSA